MLKAKKGRLLISEPFLNDSIFFKSVILLTHHDNVESIGLILNYPTKIYLNEILNNIPSSEFPVYIGGPVAKQSLHFIHTLGKQIPNSTKITDDIYFGGDSDAVLNLMEEKKITKNEIRFFIGYSGWGENQLANEIKENSWIVEDDKDKICMKYSTKKLWEDIIKIKKDYAIWSNIPKDPNLN